MNGSREREVVLASESEEDSSQRSLRGADDRHACLAKIERSDVFQSFITSVIVLNTTGLACEANDPDKKYWDVIDHCFLYIYTAELALRLVVYGFGFFCNRDWRWNLFDFVIVLTGLSHELVVHTNTAFGKLVMAMRIMRLLRILRAFKIFIKFRALQRLGVAMLKSIGSVGWIALFFFVLVLVFAVFVTVIIARDPDAWDDEEDNQIVEEAFGSLPQSMNTLAIYLTLDDWSVSARAVNKVYPWMEIVWVLYIMLGAFMILSLLTGLMADQMADARAEMAAEDNAQDSEEIDKQLQHFRDKFSKGWLGCSEFADLLQESKMEEVLDRCGVKVKDDSGRKWLFRSIDIDGNGRLTWDEFHEAFTDIGNHRDTAAALREVLWMEGKVIRLDRFLADEVGERRGRGEKPDAAEIFEEELQDVHARSSLLRRRLVTLENDLQDFFKSRRKNVVGALAAD